MPVLIGTSGWQYRHWRERFYPARLSQRAWLEHYAEHFSTVESNNAFYMLPKPETFASWRERTPGDFRMAVKANRYITHIRRLRDATDAVHRFTSSARRLGDKLGPVLLQLPPNLKVDLRSLAEVLDAFEPTWRVAVEFRHPSWFGDETRALLEDKRAALCLADRHSKPVTALWRTTEWAYIRLHEGAASPHPCYGRSALETWARRVADEWGAGADVFFYFNNDGRACALRDARLFAAAAARAGLETTRVPEDAVAVA